MEVVTAAEYAPLEALRACVSAHEQPVLLRSARDLRDIVQSVSNCGAVLFPTSNNLVVASDAPTAFVRTASREHVALVAVLFAWQCRDDSVTDYIRKCQDANIVNLSFLERADLVAWLQGADSSEHIIEPQAVIAPAGSQAGAVAGIQAGTAAETQAGAVVDKVAGSGAGAGTAATVPASRKHNLQHQHRSESLKCIYAAERPVVDHLLVLRGAKPTDFSSLRKDVSEYLHRHQSLHSNTPIPNRPKPNEKSSRKHKDPIIILSPSASSLLTMHNVKEFLGEGRFVPPEEAIRLSGDSKAPELVALSHPTSRVRRGELRFVVVDGVDQFKPDYWERVVCIFTTGQAWQFRDYHISEPVKLFHAYKGIILQYSGETAHPAASQWNVDLIRVDRQKRHTDEQIVSTIWRKIEDWMIKNWPLWKNFQ